MLKKKKFSEETGPSLIKWIQKQIVEYDIKSKCPEEYSTVDKVGSEKPLGSKSCFVSGINHLLISFLNSNKASET